VALRRDENYARMRRVGPAGGVWGGARPREMLREPLPLASVVSAAAVSAAATARAAAAARAAYHDARGGGYGSPGAPGLLHGEEGGLEGLEGEDAVLGGGTWRSLGGVAYGRADRGASDSSSGLGGESAGLLGKGRSLGSFSSTLPPFDGDNGRYGCGAEGRAWLEREEGLASRRAGLARAGPWRCGCCPYCRSSPGPAWGQARASLCGVRRSLAASSAPPSAVPSRRGRRPEPLPPGYAPGSPVAVAPGGAVPRHGSSQLRGPAPYAIAEEDEDDEEGSEGLVSDTEPGETGERDGFMVRQWGPPQPAQLRRSMGRSERAEPQSGRREREREREAQREREGLSRRGSPSRHIQQVAGQLTDSLPEPEPMQPFGARTQQLPVRPVGIVASRY
jgi:hypothetical protein